jgi:two-component system cell cycle response regulator
MNSIEILVKPRVLIADDSRIVRATLIKRIEGMFEFREALDGEEAWETLLIDPSIRVVITDLTMPKLDGYGLLRRIRASKISRIRNIPVVVISGSDEQEERERAKEAGATDLITKGIGTAQLLSRLDILSKLVNTQREFERTLEISVEHKQTEATVALSSPEQLISQAEIMLDNATKNNQNFVLLNVRLGLKHIGLDGGLTLPPISVVNAIGQLLQRSARQSDCVAATGEAEFTLVTGSMPSHSVRNFAQRVCRAIAGANLIKDDRITFVVSCGLATLLETGALVATPALNDLRMAAHRRAMLGIDHAVSGVVGVEEENAFKLGPGLGPIIGSPTIGSPTLSAGEQLVSTVGASPDLATLLQWVKEGKQDQVLKHLGTLSSDLQPLIALMLQQGRQ